MQSDGELGLLLGGAAALGALLVAMLFIRALRTFVLTGLFVVIWLVVYEEYKESIVARATMAGARAAVTRTVALMSKLALDKLATT